MLRELERFHRRGCRVEIIYMDRHGQLSQREVIILSVRGNRVTAYCCNKRAIRRFNTDGILAVMPKVIAS